MGAGLKRAAAHAQKTREAGPLAPAVTVLVKLGSIAVHADEMMSSDGHHFDQIALRGLLQDPEIVAWIKQMDAMAMVPKKRSERA